MKQKLAGIFSGKLALTAGLVLSVVGVFGLILFSPQPVSAQSLAPDGPKNCTKTGGDFGTSYKCTDYITTGGTRVDEGTCTQRATTTCDPVFVRDATADDDPAGGGEDGDTESGPQCGIEGGLGWIVCPAAWLTSRVIDGALLFLHQMLYVSPLSMDFNTQNNPMYAIWSAVRNLANVLFAMVFLIIIFSQATSIGISNYGIKRMLPRIIVAAVLVNASYFIAAIGIEVSNLFGRGVTSMMDAIMANTGAGQSQGTEIGFEAVVLGLLFIGGSAAALFALAPEFSMSAILAAVLPILIIAAFAVFVALVTLIARQAIIIMLVVLAPLAFVANLLPNTEGLYKKWQKLFMTMLIFYPLVVFVFSGAQVAAYILRATSDGGALMQVFSLGVQVVPLFALPFLFKTAGGVLGKVHGMVNQPDKLGVGRLRKEAEQFRDDQRLKARGQNYEGRANGKDFGKLNPRRFATRRVRKASEAEGKRRSMQQNLDTLQSEHLAGKMLDDKFAEKMTGGIDGERGIIRAQASGVAALRKLENEEASNMIQLLDYAANKEGTTIKDYAKVRAAAVNDKFSNVDLEKGTVGFYKKNQDGAYVDSRGDAIDLSRAGSDAERANMLSQRGVYNELSGVTKNQLTAIGEYAAANKEIPILEHLRGSEHVNQDAVTDAITRNDGTVKAGGGFHIATDLDLRVDKFESKEQFDKALDKARLVNMLAGSSAMDIGGMKFGEFVNVANSLTPKDSQGRIIPDQQGALFAQADRKSQQTIANTLHEVMTNPQAKANASDRIQFVVQAAAAINKANVDGIQIEIPPELRGFENGNGGSSGGSQGGSTGGGQSGGGNTGPSGGSGPSSGGGGTSGGGSTGGSGTSGGNTGPNSGPGPSPSGSGSSSGGNQGGPQGGRPSGGGASGGQSGTPSGSGGSGPNPNQGGPTGGPQGEYKVPHDKNPPPPPGSFLG